MYAHRTAILQLAAVLTLGCDSSVQTAEQAPATQPDALPSSAVTPTSSQYVAAGRVDLQAVVDAVADGSIDTAAELEAKLAVETVASVDLDADGKRDELRVVERREEKRTVFEVRAVPSAKVKVEGEAKGAAAIELTAAPVVAELELEAKADAGAAVFRASYSPSFIATTKLDSHSSVEHTFTGVSVSADGHMHVDVGANAFLSWSFEVKRPRYVAAVFIIEHHVVVEPDPCWPPGHCKHGFWKATGHGKHGHEHDDHIGVHVRFDGHDDHFRGGKSKGHDGGHGKSKHKHKGGGHGKGGKGKGK